MQQPNPASTAHHILASKIIVNKNKSKMSAPSLPAWSHGLLWAASEGDTERLRSLLKRGESPDTTGGVVCWLRGASEFQKRTPLHYAAKSGHPDCMKLLLLYGADPNCTDEDGYTPIHYVCQMFKPIGRQKAEDICRCLKYLIDFGADIRARTKSSYTPMELALRHKNSECANELQKHGMGKKQQLHCKENFSSYLFFFFFVILCQGRKWSLYWSIVAVWCVA